MKTLEQMLTLRCTRCGHSWIRRKVEAPKTCPHCSSPYWSKPRQRKATVEAIAKRRPK